MGKIETKRAEKEAEDAKEKHDIAQKRYDDYIQSEEYKNARQSYYQNQEKDGSTVPSSAAMGQKPQIFQDETEQKLRQERDQAESAQNYANQQAQAAEAEQVTNANLAEINAMPAEDRIALERYAVGTEVDRWESLNPAQNGFQIGRAQNQAADLIEKYGQEKVDQLAESWRRNYNAQQKQEIEKSAQEAAGKGTGSAILHSAGSVAANLAGSIAQPIDYLMQLGSRTGQYETLDPNSTGTIFNTYSSNVRGTVAQNIAGENNNPVRQALAYVYQGGMSAADNLARIALTGNPTLSLGLAATGSFGQTMSEASANGATPEQAVLMAVANGGLEVLTEKIPLDELFKTWDGGKQTAKQIVLGAFKQAGLEATSEEINFLSQMVAEAAILGEKSSYNQQIGELVANGMSYEDAKQQANNTVWKEAFDTAITSGISGGFAQAGAGIRANMAAAGQLNTQQSEATEQTTAAIPDTAMQQAQEAAQQVQEQPQAGQIQQDNTQGDSTVNLAEGIPTLQTEQRVKTEAETNMDQTLTDILSNGEQQQRENAGAISLEQNNPVTNATQEDVQSSTQQEDIPSQSTQEGQTTQPTKAVGAAEQNFSGKSDYQNLLYEGNVQRDRAGDVRPMEVPKTDSYGRKVSEFVGNAYGAEITPDRMANQIETLVQEGALGFDRRSNREGMTQAADYIQQKGMAATRNEITRSIANGRIKDGDIEKAMLLYAEYSSRKSQGAMDNASEIMVDLATMANMAGRNLQLFKLMRKMTPEGQLMTEKKRIQRWVDSMNQKRGAKDQVQVTIPSELESEYLQAAKEAASAKTEEAKQKAQKKQAETADAMNKVAASQVKATMKEKWDAWRYMAMLGNPLTQVRNVVGNAGFIPYKEAKDKIGAVIEKAIPKQMRTKSLVQDRDLLAWAREDAKTEQVRNALKYSSRLGDDVQKQKLEENRTIFETKALESVRKFVEQVPQAGDMLFKNPYYSRSLAGFLKARGYTAAEVQSGKVSDAVLSEARGYAIQEAMKATFNDSNSFSDFVSGLRYKGENPVGKAANIIAEGVLPFRRTPANIAVRFKEYSPIELARGLWDVAAEVNSGKVSAATAIDRVSSGLTGTAAMAFGYALANGMFGVKITGSGSDEDEQRQGRQDYALEFSIGGQDYSYTIDWAAPANLPLFVGANIYNGLKDIAEDPDTSAFIKILQATGTMFEPMLELSCLSSLNDLVEGLRYAQEGEAIYTLATDIATSYLKQGIPSLFRQAYKMTQDKTQTTFANSSDATIRDFQRTVAGLPFVGAAYQTDKVNAWGQTEETGSWIERAAKTFVSPGTLKKIDTGKLETEISRLNEVQEENVSPAAFDKVLSWTDKDGNLHKDQRLTEEQYQTLATTQGQTQARILNSLIESKDYNAMTDSQKAEAFKLVYQYAREQGEAAAIGPERTSKADSWMMELSEGSEADAIVRKVTADTLDRAMSAMSSAWENGYNTEGNETQLEDAYESYSNLSGSAKEVVQDQVGSSASNYLEAREQGVSQDDFLSVTKNIADLKPEGDGVNPNQKQKVEAIAYDDTLSEEEKEVMLRLYVSDAQKENIDELKELGYGMEDYAKLYRLVEDFTKGTGKKDRTSAEIARQYNISISAARQLYEVFK